MKETLATAAARNLSDEDRDMLRRLALATGEDGPRAALDMGLRDRLCAEMAEMADAVRSLLALLDRHDAVAALPERALPAYQDVMEQPCGRQTSWTGRAHSTATPCWPLPPPKQGRPCNSCTV